jgi:phosphatidate cytidylyltransferase
MVEKKGVVIFKYFGLGIGLVILLSLSFRFEVTRGWELLFITLALLSLILTQFRRRESSGVVIGLSTTIFGILYITWFMGFLIKIRYLDYGVGMLATVVWITKVGDIGAYLLGSRFGRHTLISRISPNKTREGFLGGILFSLFAALGTKFLMPVSYSYAHLLILGFCLGVLGQLGDLSESLMKRDCAVKDSGNIFPGLGGALDCIDSLLFSAPVFYFWVLHFGS